MATAKKSTKKVVEKKTGEKYYSKEEKKKHENREKGNLKEMMKEYGPRKAFAMMKAKSKKK